MHLYDQIEEYNFTHGNHFDTASGQYNLLMPHDLGRPLTHEEMDYNFLYQKQTMNGFRIFGSGTNLRLDDNDLDKVKINEPIYLSGINSRVFEYLLDFTQNLSYFRYKNPKADFGRFSYNQLRDYFETSDIKHLMDFYNI